MAVKQIISGNTVRIVNDRTNKELLTMEGDNKGNLRISGAIKTNVAADFSVIIMDMLKSSLVVTLDFADVSYIASAGLRALLTAQQYIDDMAEDKFMIIRNINDEVRDVFESTGFINILNVMD